MMHISDDSETTALHLALRGMTFAELVDENMRLGKELQRERMRLAACGVVALADTPESAPMARDMHPDYRSAACDDVARRVDECMALRKDAERYRWLRKNPQWLGWDHDFRPDEVEREIDAAMAATPGVGAA